MAILDDILGGKYDDQLDRIRETCEMRRREVAYQSAATLRPGDKVMLKSIRPKYLQGTICTVVGFAHSKIRVRMPDDYGLGRYRGLEVRVPQTTVQRVDVAPEVAANSDEDWQSLLPKPEPGKRVAAVWLKMEEGSDENPIGPIGFRYVAKTRSGRERPQWRPFDPNAEPPDWFSLSEAEFLAKRHSVGVEVV